MTGLWIPVMAFVLGALAGLLFKESRDQRVRTKPFDIFFSKETEKMEDIEDKRPVCPICGGHLGYWTAGSNKISVGCECCRNTTMCDYPTRESAMEAYLGAAERYVAYLESKEEATA